MALIDRVAAVQRRQPERFIVFGIDDVSVGFPDAALAEELLTALPELVSRSANGIVLDVEVGGPEQITMALGVIADYLQTHGLMMPPRNELYAVRNSWQDPPVGLIERNAASPLGLVAFGVNLNAWTLDADGDQQLWIGRRSLSKQTEPGKLDHIAAGGQPASIGLRENIIKEAAGEAGIPASLAGACRPVGAVSGHYHSDHCRRFIHYNFDLELPGDFVPRPMDGEVDEFFTAPVDEVIDLLRSGYHFDLETAIAVIDWLIRHGHIHAENEPDFDMILQGLTADLFRL